MDPIREVLRQWADYLRSFPAWEQTLVLVIAGLALTLSATKRFEHEPVMALAYITVAVVLFWIALLRFM